MSNVNTSVGGNKTVRNFKYHNGQKGNAIMHVTSGNDNDSSITVQLPSNRECDFVMRDTNTSVGGYDNKTAFVVTNASEMGASTMHKSYSGNKTGVEIRGDPAVTYVHSAELKNVNTSVGGMNNKEDVNIQHTGSRSGTNTTNIQSNTDNNTSINMRSLTAFLDAVDTSVGGRDNIINYDINGAVGGDHEEGSKITQDFDTRNKTYIILDASQKA